MSDPARTNPADPVLYRIAVSHAAGACTVTLAGELDLVSRNEVQNVLFDEIADAGDRELIVDMAAVSFFDSTAISALVAAYHHARESDVRLTIARPSRQVAKVLQLTGLLDLFSDGVTSE